MVCEVRFPQCVTEPRGLLLPAAIRAVTELRAGVQESCFLDPFLLVFSLSSFT